MKNLRRLTALALPVVAAMLLGVPANAAWSNGSSTGAGDRGSASHADSPGTMAVRSYIYNGSGYLSFGVIYARDGDYKYPKYDAVLPPVRRTDGSPLYWDRAEGFYVGAGYCAWLSYWNGSRWVDNGTVGSGQWWPDQTITGQSIARWEVTQFPC